MNVCLKCLFVTSMFLLAISFPGFSQTVISGDDARQTAILMEQQGRNTEAKAAWQEVLKTNPQNSEAYAHLGLLESRQQEYAKAILLYRKALKLNPSMPGLRLNLGLALFKSGDLHSAVQTLAPLLKDAPPSSPETQRLNVLLGMAHFGLDEYAAAIPYLREASLHDQQSLELRLLLVQSCLGAKQLECVQDVYHQILLLNPDSVEADMIAGEVMDEMHDGPGAVQQFQAAVKANPLEPNVHFGLGYELWKLKRYDEALSEFEAELRNIPNHSLALAYLGDTKMRLQDPEGAQVALEGAARVSNDIELVHLDLGILYANKGRQSDALQELKLAEQLEPDDTTVHWRLAHLYQMLGKKNEAQAELQQTQHIIKNADDSVFSKLHVAEKIRPTPSSE